MFYPSITQLANSPESTVIISLRIIFMLVMQWFNRTFLQDFYIKVLRIIFTFYTAVVLNEKKILLKFSCRILYTIPTIKNLVLQVGISKIRIRYGNDVALFKTIIETWYIHTRYNVS